MAYEYDLESRAMTNGETTFFNIINAGLSYGIIEQGIIREFSAKLPEQITSEFGKKGVNVTSVSNINVQVIDHQRVGWEYWLGIPVVQRTFLKLEIVWSAHIVTDQPIHGQSLLVSIVWAIKQLTPLILGLVAIYIIAPIFSQGIIDWLKAMTVTTISHKVYDPNTGDLIEEHIEEYPNIGGIGGVGLIMIAMVAVVLLFMVGMPKKR